VNLCYRVLSFVCADCLCRRSFVVIVVMLRCVSGVVCSRRLLLFVTSRRSSRRHMCSHARAVSLRFPCLFRGTRRENEVLHRICAAPVPRFVAFA